MSYELFNVNDGSPKRGGIYRPEQNRTEGAAVVEGRQNWWRDEILQHILLETLFYYYIFNAPGVHLHGCRS